MTTFDALTIAQRTALEDLIHGDGIVALEDAGNGAVLATLETAPHCIVEADGTLLDDSGNPVQ